MKKLIFIFITPFSLSANAQNSWGISEVQQNKFAVYFLDTAYNEHHVIEWKDTTDMLFNLDSIKWRGISFVSQDIINFKIAHGWGNHAGLYKLTSYVPAWQEITSKPVFHSVAISGDYDELIDQPLIPTNTNQLINGAGFLTENPVSDFGAAGPITITKRWIGTVTPLTGNGYVIDISSAGFTNVLGYQIIAVRNTVITSSMPTVSVKAVSANAISVNIIEANTSVINILGNNVLNGLPMVFSNVLGLTLNVIVYGN